MSSKVETVESRRESRTVVYICSECSAEDHVKFWTTEPIFQVLNCWNCKAGRGKEVPQMLQSHVGMFPQLEQAGQLVTT